MNYHKKDTSLGPIFFITDEKQNITRLGFTPLLDETPSEHFLYSDAFDAYLNGKTLTLALPHVLNVTPYQKKVLSSLAELTSPITYQDLANKLDSHPRAIGQALKRNPLPLIYPCHKVTAKNHLGGFCGKAKLLDIKEKLLKRDKIALMRKASC